MSDTTTPVDTVHPLDWTRMEVSPRFCRGREYYPAITINVRDHALRKAIYNFNVREASPRREG